MANQTSFYVLDTTAGYFSGIWKLTRLMKKAGWTYKASGDGNATKDTTGTASNDLWGGNADPSADSYPTAFSARAGPWICLAGPSVLKIQISVASVGTFTRGEQVSQATSGATGELVGYVFDASNGGWLVVLPRTGSFDATHQITGATSAATATPSATILTYTQEVVIWKPAAAINTGTIYYICADASGESASLFSTLAGSAGCTATIAPGGGGTGNSFPTQGLVIAGTGSSSASPIDWIGQASTSNFGIHAFIFAANATPGSGVSADGSFWIAFPNSNTGFLSIPWLGLMRLDDSAPGDVNPFAWRMETGVLNSAWSRTSAATSASQLSTWANAYASSNLLWNGWVARGVGGTPGTIPDVGTPLEASWDTGAAHGTSLSQFVIQSTDVVKDWNSPATNKPIARDNFRLYGTKSGQQIKKGQLRWCHITSIGGAYDTADSKTSICVFGAVAGSAPAVWLDGWDGSTTPVP